MELPTVGEVLKTEKMEIASDETVSGKEYRDGAIEAFGLKPND